MPYVATILALFRVQLISTRGNAAAIAMAGFVDIVDYLAGVRGLAPVGQDEKLIVLLVVLGLVDPSCHHLHQSCNWNVSQHILSRVRVALQIQIHQTRKTEKKYL